VTKTPSIIPKKHVKMLLVSLETCIVNVNYFNFFKKRLIEPRWNMSDILWWY